MSLPAVDDLRVLELDCPGPSRAYLNENEPWEQVGERLVLVDDDLDAVGLIEATRVVPTTFSEMTWAFAEAEGDGSPLGSPTLRVPF